MDLELVPLLQSQEQVAIARNQRTLGDDSERQALAAGQPLQHRPRDTKPPLGGLIRIGRGPDDDAFAERHALEIGLEGADDVLLHEDPLLERFPAVRAAVIRELGVGQLAGIVRALDHVAMRVARIAVAAAEFTADVWIQRPVVHSGRARRVQHTLRR